MKSDDIKNVLLEGNTFSRRLNIERSCQVQQSSRTVLVKGEKAIKMIEANDIAHLQRLIIEMKTETNVKIALTKFYEFLSMPFEGRSKNVRKSGILDEFIGKIANMKDEEKFIAARIIQKCLTTSNRFYLIQHALESSVDLAKFSIQSNDHDQKIVGISMLKIMFEHGEEIADEIAKFGGVRAIVGACRKGELNVVRLCSSTIFNIALFGGKECKNQLMRNDMLKEWFLIMMDIYEDKTIKYFAFLTITVLKIIHDVDHELFKNGILDDAVCFMSPETTSYLFGHVKIESFDQKDMMKRLMPLLTSKFKIAQSLGAYHFYLEASHISISKLNFFYCIGAVRALKRIALCSNEFAQSFAINALQLVGEMIRFAPLPEQIYKWTSKDVQEWLKSIELDNYIDYFSDINGVQFLKLRDRDLKESFFMFDSSKRIHFMEEREHLKTMNRISSIGLYEARSLLKLQNDKIGCIDNRTNVSNDGKDPSSSSTLVTILSEPKLIKKRNDVFISYRRSNGADLASLLRTQLVFKKYKIFFDVINLQAGIFATNLLRNVQQSRNFLLVLTKNSLDRCISGKVEEDDFFYKEIVTALSSKCNIIPVVKDFDNAIFDIVADEIKPLKDFNQIQWHHDVQDECIRKIEEYMQKPQPKTCSVM